MPLSHSINGNRVVQNFVLA